MDLIEKYLGEKETKWDLYVNNKKANKKPMSKKEMEDMEEKFNKMGRKTRSEIVEAKGSSSASKMECMECGHKFKKKLGKNTFEVKCPKCKGYDVEPA
jgi:Zn finger protein HypA/HybF involved in hydrogenase expression